MVILGIDPALNRVGYGILFYDSEKGNIVDIKYGVYDIPQKDKMESKLYKSFETTQALIDRHNVDEVVIEKAFHNPKRAKGGMVVREAIGAIKVAAKQAGKPIYMYSPQSVKKIVAGSGRAKKYEVACGIADILNIPEFEINIRFRGKMQNFTYSPRELVDKELDHVSDALSISYCRLLEIKNSNREVDGNAV